MKDSFAIIKPRLSKKIRDIYGIISLIIYIFLTVILGIKIIPLIYNYINIDCLQIALTLVYFLSFASAFIMFYSRFIDKFEIIGLIEFKNDFIYFKKQSEIQQINIDFIKYVKLKYSLGFSRNNKAAKSYIVDFVTKDNNLITFEITRNLYIDNTFIYNWFTWKRKDLFHILKKYKIAYKLK
jgi:hypothetical protein